MQPAYVKRLSRAIAVFGSVLTAVVASLAFLVSFEAIRVFSVHSGAVSVRLSYCIPPLLDATIVLASAIWLSRSLMGEGAFAPKLVLVMAATGSLAMNEAHGPSTLAAWSVSLIAPAMLVMTTELAMSEVKRHVRRRFGGFSQIAGGGAPSAAKETPVDLSGLSEALKDAADTGTVSGNTLSQALQRRGVNVPPRDARRLLAAIRGPQQYDLGTEVQEAELVEQNSHQ